MAEVNDKGEVTVEGEFAGRLEGFRFIQDAGAQGQEAKTLKQASLQALAPHFHLRADRFYNAPDTEIDFTEQGGLMWGDQAVGRLAAGDDPLKPRIVAFVDDTAGADVAQKVERRLQHFMDRKIAALFEPLMNLKNDETLTGLARGFAFQMVEAMGVLPRAAVAEDVKALDQEARGALRKHGIRFGQYTIFMQLLLKPAPTRLRLVLWSLARGIDDFPSSPPPGLVTVPSKSLTPEGVDAVAGYRISGDRAIRIDMLERLADQLRSEDSRGGFEAKADMLSITGMTLEQFADLMGGLGYKAERGEREKVKAVDAVTTAPEPAADAPVMDTAAEAAPGTDADAAEAPAPADLPEPVADIADEGVAPIAAEPAESSVAQAVPDVAADEMAPGATPDAAIAGPETEVFYTFTWGRKPPNQQGRRQGGGARGDRGKGGAKGGGKPQGKGRGKGGKPSGPKTFEARPPKKDKPIDPDNPFAALAALKKG